MLVKMERCLVIENDEWFTREDFKKYLNSPLTTTWHQKGMEPGEMSDVFIVYDQGDSADYHPDHDCEALVPHDIWSEIMKRAIRHGFEYGVVWIKNGAGGG